MQDALRMEFHRQAAESGETAKAKLLTMEAMRAKVVPPLEPDDMISPMAFSARLLGLDERSSFVWIKWAAGYAQHIEDADTRKVLTDHVCRTRLLSMKLDVQKTSKIWVREALTFAREQGWVEEPSAASRAPNPLPAAPPAPRDTAAPAANVKRYGVAQGVLIDRYKSRWTTIRADFSEASRNGLSRARLGKGPRADWDEEAVLEWARARGKLRETDATASVAMATFMSVLPSKVHRIAH